MEAATLDFSAMQVLDHRKMEEMRRALELTQVEAAARAGMSVSRWNDIESGRRIKNLKLETISSVAAALGCADVRELITPPEKKSKRGK